MTTTDSVYAHAGPLEPEDLLLVYNGNDPRSRELAEYYAKARTVPLDRLCPVSARLNQEDIRRDDYNRLIRDPVRNYLETHSFGRRIRCIVLFYGLPIRIGPKIASTAEQRLAGKWEQRFKTTLGVFEQIVDGLGKLASSQPVTPGTTPAPVTADQPLFYLVQRYNQAREAASARVTAHMSTAEGQEEYRQLVATIQAAEGLVGVLARARLSNPTPQVISVVEKYVNQARATETQAAELFERPLTDPKREAARELIQKNHGLIGMLGSLNHDIMMLRTEETTASVDSELTLLWWNPYVLYRWIPNMLAWDVRSNPARLMELTQAQQRAPVLMTCRIDGPSMEVCRRIIDQSMAAERAGLEGKVYIDARGLSVKNAHGPFDQELRDLADMLQRDTKLDVHLDNQGGLFGPGSCADAMLYCGWYSVRNYVGAFQFVPGAVGYHVASFEAVSLKSPAERGWVRGLLKDGIDATMGSVAEPYLHSFPKPTLFFGLLLSGRFSLAECYAYTNELNSWMMLLIGDPLYRPFARNPQLKLEQVYATDRIPSEFRSTVSSQPTPKSN